MYLIFLAFFEFKFITPKHERLRAISFCFNGMSERKIAMQTCNYLKNVLLSMYRLCLIQFIQKMLLQFTNIANRVIPFFLLSFSVMNLRIPFCQSIRKRIFDFIFIALRSQKWMVHSTYFRSLY